MKILPAMEPCGVPPKDRKSYSRTGQHTMSLFTWAILGTTPAAPIKIARIILLSAGNSVLHLRHSEPGPLNSRRRMISEPAASLQSTPLVPTVPEQLEGGQPPARHSTQPRRRSGRTGLGRRLVQPAFSRAWYLIHRGGKRRRKNNDQVNCCCWLCRSRRNFGASNNTSAGSSAGRHDHASSPMGCGPFRTRIKVSAWPEPPSAIPAEWSAGATAGATERKCPTEPDVRNRTPGSPLLTDDFGEWVCAISRPGPPGQCQECGFSDVDV